MDLEKDLFISFTKLSVKCRKEDSIEPSLMTLGFGTLDNTEHVPSAKKHWRSKRNLAFCPQSV